MSPVRSSRRLLLESLENRQLMATLVTELPFAVNALAATDNGLSLLSEDTAANQWRIVRLNAIGSVLSNQTIAFPATFDPQQVSLSPEGDFILALGSSTLGSQIAGYRVRSTIPTQVQAITYGANQSNFVGEILDDGRGIGTINGPGFLFGPALIGNETVGSDALAQRRYASDNDNWVAGSNVDDTLRLTTVDFATYRIETDSRTTNLVHQQLVGSLDQVEISNSGRYIVGSQPADQVGRLPEELIGWEDRDGVVSSPAAQVAADYKPWSGLSPNGAALHGKVQEVIESNSNVRLLLDRSYPTSIGSLGTTFRETQLWSPITGASLELQSLLIDTVLRSDNPVLQNRNFQWSGDVAVSPSGDRIFSRFTLLDQASPRTLIVGVDLVDLLKLSSYRLPLFPDRNAFISWDNGAGWQVLTYHSDSSFSYQEPVMHRMASDLRSGATVALDFTAEGETVLAVSPNGRWAIGVRKLSNNQEQIVLWNIDSRTRTDLGTPSAGYSTLLRSRFFVGNDGSYAAPLAGATNPVVKWKSGGASPTIDVSFSDDLRPRVQAITPDGDWLIGSKSQSGTTVPFLWTEDGPILFAAQLSAEFNSISPTGRYIGGSRLPSGETASVAAIWEDLDGQLSPTATESNYGVTTPIKSDGLPIANGTVMHVTDSGYAFIKTDDGKAYVWKRGWIHAKLLSTWIFEQTGQRLRQENVVPLAISQAGAAFLIQLSNGDLHRVTVEGKGGQNPLGNLNANGDRYQMISPIDALVVINYLNSSVDDSSYKSHWANPFFLDVSGDELISPVDALLVINFLNNTLSGEGEAKGDLERQAMYSLEQGAMQHPDEQAEGHSQQPEGQSPQAAKEWSYQVDDAMREQLAWLDLQDGDVHEFQPTLNKRGRHATIFSSRLRQS